MAGKVDTGAVASPTIPTALRSALALATLLVAAVSQTPAWHRLPTSLASASQGLAYDEHRERMVRVEASMWHGVFHTWEWIDGTWSLRRTATTPPLRDDFAFAYDPVRKVSVLFGGRRIWNYGLPGAMFDDTWEYDGVDWRQVNTPVRPPPQLGGWMGFDYATNRLLLVGGVSQPSWGGTWFYDGTTWVSGPFVSLFPSSAGFASDPVRQRIVVANWGAGADVETWEWNGTSWGQVPAQFAPPRRIAPALAFHPGRQTVVMTGGGFTFGPDPTDLWEWDGTTWSQVPSNPAPERQGHLAMYDVARDRLVLLGGGRSQNTVEWDGADWAGVDPVVAWDDMDNAYFDGNLQRVVAFALGPNNQMEWDGRRWHRQPSPMSMYRARLCFDWARMRAVAVGTIWAGLVTLEWDGQTWAPWSVAALPCQASMTFHTTRGRVMACCGSGGLWEWDGTVWTQVAAGPGSPWTTLDDALAVYDAARDEIVLVTWQGGVAHTATWNGTSWNVASQASGPAARTRHDLTYDPVRQRVVLYGGRDEATSPPTYFDHPWEWDGSSWQQRVLPNAPTPRARHGIVFDPVRQQLLVLGGRTHMSNIAEIPVAETWAIDAQPSADVVVLGPGCSGSMGPAQLLVGAPYPGAEVVPFEVHSSLVDAPCMFGFGFGPGNVPVGAGCTQYLASQDQLWLGFTNASGDALHTVEMPLTLFGFSFAVQAAVLDASNPRGVTLSDGLLVTVGH